ncbi:MAG TPA: hypothetical protein VFX48_04940 [Saprospiraceae bacterium]|nr:hypothetical protein [Saprospiraceae bacterium]
MNVLPACKKSETKNTTQVQQAPAEEIIQTFHGDPQILGSWALTPGGQTVFHLDSFFIRFMEEVPVKRFSYSLSGDSLVIRFDAFPEIYRFQLMEGDSMRLISTQSKTTYYRVD